MNAIEQLVKIVKRFSTPKVQEREVRVNDGGQILAFSRPINDAVESGKLTYKQAKQMQELGYVPEWRNEAISKMASMKATPAVLGAEALPTTNQETPDWGKFASDWYTSVGHAQQAPQASLIASKAAQYGLDPYMALALSAQEGGWSRYYPETSPYNYFGWGVTDSGDMGFKADSLEAWLDKYMPDIAKQYGGRKNITDWGGSLKGYGAGSPYKARYNYNDSWVEALSSLVNQAQNYKNKYYPTLPATTINTNYRK